MVKVTIKHEDFRNWFRRLIVKVERNVSFAFRKGSRKVAAGYRENMARGLDASGRPMASVSEATMNLPVRVTTDKRPRRSVNPSVNGLVATGATAKSVKEKRVSRTEYIIESTSARGNAILASGARPGSANRGIIKGPRKKRDPLTVTDKQVDIIENEILNQLDKAFR